MNERALMPRAALVHQRALADLSTGAAARAVAVDGACPAVLRQLPGFVRCSNDSRRSADTRYDAMVEVPPFLVLRSALRNRRVGIMGAAAVGGEQGA